MTASLAAPPDAPRRRRPPAAPTTPSWPHGLRAVLLRPPTARHARTPVWFMRQAGRSLPEYRKVREGTAMLDSCFTADLVVEITDQPVRRHGVDAAIFFSDIVVPLKAIGVDLDIVPGVGPVVAEPIRDAAGIAKLRDLTEEDVAPVLEAVRILAGPSDRWAAPR